MDAGLLLVTYVYQVAFHMGLDNLIFRCSCDESSYCSSNRTFLLLFFVKQAEILGKMIRFFSFVFICFCALVCLYPLHDVFFNL